MLSDNSEDVAFEAATNNRYLSALAERLGRSFEVAVPVNEKWLGHIPHSGISFDDFGPLVGRVGLDVDDPDLGTSFYIGARWIPDFEERVVSWAAPMARVFYYPNVTTGDVARDVTVRRTLLERGNVIVKVYDAWVVDRPADPSPFRVKKLELPAAPRATDRGRRPTAAIPRPPDSSEVILQTQTDAAKDSAGTQRGLRHDMVAPPEGLERGMRAADAVKYALQVPRSAALSSVLSTLQPDQYELVTRPGGEPLVIQGHPGTGKTIIGIHRAAYLVSDERPGNQRAERLLLIGPTDEWVRHVAGIVSTLDIDRRVTVKSLPTWLVELAGTTHQLTDDLDGSADDVGMFVKDVVRRAAVLARRDHPWEAGAEGRVHNAERLYTVLRNGGNGSEKLPLGDLSSRWIKTLPGFDSAIRKRRYSALFAQMHLSISRALAIQYDHVIVDEAQDVAGLEWAIIAAHNRSGEWTLVGDMNQRRNDYGDGSWKHLANRLALWPNDQVKVDVIRRGYRSTQAILDFAKDLLPRSERDVRSLQNDGPRPTVSRARTVAECDDLAVGEAERLLSSHSGGSVAVITVDPRRMEPALFRAGWRRTGQSGDWRRDALALAVRTPQTARGIEFDGVVVVEPGAFPKNLGRVGPLYTSLTRANRELAVVHCRALPDALRHHGRA